MPCWAETERAGSAPRSRRLEVNGDAVGISCASPAGSTSGASMQARRSRPAAPSVAYCGRLSRSRASRISVQLHCRPGVRPPSSGRTRDRPAGQKNRQQRRRAAQLAQVVPQQHCAEQPRARRPSAISPKAISAARGTRRSSRPRGGDVPSPALSFSPCSTRCASVAARYPRRPPGASSLTPCRPADRCGSLCGRIARASCSRRSSRRGDEVACGVRGSRARSRLR